MYFSLLKQRSFKSGRREYFPLSLVLFSCMLQEAVISVVIIIITISSPFLVIFVCAGCGLIAVMTRSGVYFTQPIEKGGEILVLHWSPASNSVLSLVRQRQGDRMVPVIMFAILCQEPCNYGAMRGLRGKMLNKQNQSSNSDVSKCLSCAEILPFIFMKTNPFPIKGNVVKCSRRQ